MKPSILQPATSLLLSREDYREIMIKHVIPSNPKIDRMVSELCEQLTPLLESARHQDIEWRRMMKMRGQR